MANRIYIVSDGQLRPLREQPYRDEAQLQSLLSEFPDVLEATELGGGVEHHWLLVRPELGIPSDTDTGERWRADHLLLDQEGVPTVVEVKRSTDTRVRREVVGQMLDYVAAVSTQWSADRVRQAFEDTCQANGSDPSDVLHEFLNTADGDEDAEPDPDGFWRQVQTNLDADRIRMLFVADRIPFELRRIIEFLNKQLNTAEVYGVEVRQYTGNALQAVVPVVVGETTKKRSRTDSRSAPESVEQVLETIRQDSGEESARIANKLVKWAYQEGYEVHPHKLLGGCLTVRAPLPGEGPAFAPLRIRKDGTIRVPLVFARRRPPFDNPDEIRRWLERLNELSGVDIPDRYVRKHAPDIPITAIATEEAFAHFVDTAKWAVQRVIEAEASS